MPTATTGLTQATWRQQMPQNLLSHQFLIGTFGGIALPMWLPASSRAVREPQRSIGPRKSIVDQFLECDTDAAAFLLRLLHQDVDHIELRIDAEIGATA